MEDDSIALPVAFLVYYITLVNVASLWHFAVFGHIFSNLHSYVDYMLLKLVICAKY